MSFNSQLLKDIPGIDTLQFSVQHIIDASSSRIYWKDRNGHFLGGNTTFLNDSFSSYNDFLGKKDRDLVWAEQAAFIEENDQKVMHSNTPVTVLEPVTFLKTGEVEFFLSHKIPLRGEKGKLLGVLGISFLSNDINHAMKTAKKIKTNLTPRQLDCLLYLTKGMTLKQIAKQLILSPKTVEHYLEAAKTKLKCRSRAELIFKAAQIFD